MRDIHRSGVTANGIIFGKSKGGFFVKSYAELKREMEASRPVTEKIKSASGIKPKNNESNSDNKVIGAQNRDLSKNEYVTAYKSTIELLCPLDMSAVNSNIDIALTADNDYDRVILLEPLMFVAANIAYIEAMLADNFLDSREFLSKAIVEELRKESMSSDEKTKVRMKTRDTMLNSSTNMMKIGVSFFDDSTIDSILSAAKNSFHNLFKYYSMNKFSNNVKHIPASDVFILTTIFSNFAYLLRIINNDGTFLNKLNSLIVSFKGVNNIL